MSFLKEIFRSIARVFGRVIAYVIIGLIIYLIASSRVEASQYRILNNATNGTGSWTNVTNGTAYGNSPVVYSNTYKTTFQFRDTSAFSGSNVYDLVLDFDYTINAYASNTSSKPTDAFGNIILEVYNGSNLVNISSKCSVNVTQTSTYPNNGYAIFNLKGVVTCTAVGGSSLSGYYPYFSFSAKQSGGGIYLGTSNAWLKINQWTYTRNTAESQTNAIINSNNANTNSIINNNNANTNTIINNNNQNTTEITNSVDSLNDSITDNSEPTDYSFFSDIGLSNDTPISNMLLFPVTLLNAINTSTASSCSPVSLGSLFGNELVLPCINLEQRLGSTLWSNIDTLTSIIIIYNLVMMVVSAFEDMTSLNDSFTSLTARHSAENVEYHPRHGGGS